MEIIFPEIPDAHKFRFHHIETYCGSILDLERLAGRRDRSLENVTQPELWEICGELAEFRGNYWLGFLETEDLDVHHVRYLVENEITLEYIAELIGPKGNKVVEFIDTEKRLLFQRLTTQEDWFEFNYNFDADCLYVTQANGDGHHAPHCFTNKVRDVNIQPDPKDINIDSEALIYAQLLDLMGNTLTPENFQAGIGCIKIRTNFLNSVTTARMILDHHQQFKERYRQYRRPGSFLK